ncbi:unnamed protein product [Closterium sp. NIES-53]
MGPPHFRHAFVPRSARGKRAIDNGESAIYPGERASSAQPVTRPVTQQSCAQQHAQPRGAAACTPARVAVARASSSSMHSSSGELKCTRTRNSRPRASAADARAASAVAARRYAPSLSLPRLLA